MTNEEMNDNKFSVSASLIKQVVAQIEHLEERKTEIAQEISDVFREAKNEGLDVNVLKQLIKLRKKKKEQVEEEEALLEVYRKVLEQ
ncbi:MAG: DUF2312 domain-containing protein [Alphaproteobacteria bacterium]|nr:DUF2312 domain-containing protein [Alphaproteobacteria bacterium]